jgi:hexosaminidase
VDRGASEYANIQRAKGLSSLELYLADGATVQTIAEESVKEITARSEAYTLSVPADGSSALLAANSTLGLFRGLTTFEQLWYYFGGEIYTLEAPVYINDAPAYVCRVCLSLVSEFADGETALPRVYA